MSKNFFSALDDSEDEGHTSNGCFDEREEVFDYCLNKDNHERGNKLSNSEGPLSNERRCLSNNLQNIKIGCSRPSHTCEERQYYDRRSGTRRGRDLSKGVSGSHNWESEKYEARTAKYHLCELQNNDEKINNTETSTGEISEINSKPIDNSTLEMEKTIQSDEQGKKIAEEVKTMTMEEFLKSKANPESELFKPKHLKSVNNEFIGKTARITVEEDVLILGKEKKLRKKNSKKNEKITLDVTFSNVKTMKSNKKNDKRVRRGVSRSGQGNGDNIVQKGSLNAMDTTAFPSL